LVTLKTVGAASAPVGSTVRLTAVVSERKAEVSSIDRNSCCRRALSSEIVVRVDLRIKGSKEWVCEHPKLKLVI
jgi:hypothetical protein